jgi:hypothetical protein
MSIYTPGFPYRTVNDSAATVFLHDWMSAVAHKLDVE